MPALRPRTSAEVVAALLWAIIGGALIGGVGLTATFLLYENSGQRVWEEPLLLVFGPLGIGLVSLFVVAPCKIIFGLISVAIIHRLSLGRWSALAACLATATAVQIACVWLVFWDEWSEPADFLFTAPFAQGAAVALWWRLTRP
jgi:hypothetical protein